MNMVVKTLQIHVNDMNHHWSMKMLKEVDDNELPMLVGWVMEKFYEDLQFL